MVRKGTPARFMATDFVNAEGLDKRSLGLDEVQALAAATASNRYCLDMSWGTRAPRYCGKPRGHDGTCIYFSPLQIAEGESDRIVARMAQ